MTWTKEELQRLLALLDDEIVPLTDDEVAEIEANYQPVSQEHTDPPAWFEELRQQWIAKQQP